MGRAPTGWERAFWPGGAQVGRWGRRVREAAPHKGRYDLRGTAGGTSPSPTAQRKRCRICVGEALGPPAGGMPRGHPHPSRFACHLPLKGKACGRPHGAAPTVNLETVPLFRRGRTLAGPQIYAARPGGRALQPCTSRHLLGKARRESGTAPAAIFANSGPGGPTGIAESHSNFARRKGIAHPEGSPP